MKREEWMPDAACDISSNKEETLRGTKWHELSLVLKEEV